LCEKKRWLCVEQAQARCHRIGQQKAVKVYRLITRNTYEREMFDRASLKLGLDKAVLQSMGPKELNAVRFFLESNFKRMYYILGHVYIRLLIAD